MATWNDTFAGRTAASNWGNASDGQLWNYQQNNVGMSVGSGKGQYSGNNSSQVMINTLGSNTATDVESLVRWSADNTSNVICLFLRTTDNTHYYRFDIGSLGNNTLRFGKKTGGGFSQIASATSPITYATNTSYWMKFRVQGTNLYGRIWTDGSVEPGAWHITGSDSSIASGYVGLGFNPISSQTSINFDSFSAYSVVAQSGFGNHRSIVRNR